MCYEFVHSCKSSLTDKLAMLIPDNQYFLICIGDINYLYCDNAAVKATIKTFLQSENIRLYALPADEMISVIDFPGMKACQTFHGNPYLLYQLREKLGMVREACN